MRRVRRTFALLALVGASVVALPLATPATAAPSRAVVVVDTGSNVYRTVIEFSGSVTGIHALVLAGADPETLPYGDLGDAVCKLYGFGDEAVPSQCPGRWSYYRAVGGAGTWNTSGLGASNTTVHDGDVEGWKYGSGRPGASAVFCDYVACASPTPDPAPTGDGQPAPGAAPAASPSAAGSSGSAPTDPAAAAGASEAASGDSIAVGGQAATTSTTHPSTRLRAASDDRSGREAALGASDGGGDGGSGSPVGIVVVAALLVVAAAVALLIRRRRSGRPPVGTA